MLYYKSETLDPYFNLAAEEYFLTSKTDNFFMLWVNSGCVVVGCNQNTMAEINYDFVKSNGIAVVRRLTGGGAVFHDTGNLNFTFIANEGGKFSDFAHFAEPIIKALSKIGIHAELSGRNDLCIDGRKFSGNAQCVKNGRILHHGTILLSTIKDTLSSALNPDPEKIASKGVKSVRSRITNINEHLSKPISTAELIDIIKDSVLSDETESEEYNLTDEDMAEITALREQKYATFDWNYGRSPKYTHHSKKRYPSGSVEIYLNVQSGIIVSATIYGDFFGEKSIAEFENLLIGKPHDKDILYKTLDGLAVQDWFLGLNSDDILSLLF